MWIIALSGYLLIGLLIVVSTRARLEIQREIRSVRNRAATFSARSNPLWKVVVYFAFVITSGILLWPVWLPGLFKKREMPVVRQKRTVPLRWLTKQITLEQAAQGHMFARDWRELLAQNLDGYEIWEYCSPADSWKHLAGSAGIALVRNGEVVDSTVEICN